MRIVERIMSRMSRTKEDQGYKEFELIGNAFGFFALHSGLGQSTLCLELAALIAKHNLTVCIVDCDPLSTFYLTKAMKNLNEKDAMDIPSMSRRLKKRSTPIKETLLTIQDGISVLTYGDTQYIDTFNLESAVIKDTLEELKEVFDLVILDIPGYPWLESTISSLQVCSTVYTMCQFSADTLLKKIKYDNFFSIAGMGGLLSNLVIARSPLGVSLTHTIEDRLDVRVLVELPHVDSIPNLALENIVVTDKVRGKAGIEYAKCLDFFASEIIEGIGNKEVEEGKDILKRNRKKKKSEEDEVKE